jgi:hypothetical protein
MFAAMFISNLKYQDPTKVLESVVDDDGLGIAIYEQKDIGEFFMNFLDRMIDGLGENKTTIRKLMGDDLARTQSIHQAYNTNVDQANLEILEDIKLKH